jgi:hypothetical protein
MTFTKTDLNEALMEAMILLDPPHLSRFTSQLSIPNICKALDISLTAASIEISDGKTIHDNDDECIEGKNDLEAVGILADLYRTIVLSSSLLLEMCPWEDAEQEAPLAHSSSASLSFCLAEANVKSLNQNVIHSIVLLERLSHFSYLSDALSYNDWHDELLPKSCHPLLQECFERKAMMDVEENVVFGMEDRLVSLNLEDYSNQDAANHFGEDILDLGGNGDDISQCTMERHSQDEVEGADLSLSLCPKQLEMEENELLNIAFLDDSRRKRGHSPKNKKQKLTSNCQAERDLLKRMKSVFLIQHVQIPFYGLCCVLKQGWLILKQCVSVNEDVMNKEKQLDISCRMVLFANGVIIIWPSDEASDRNEKQDLQAFSLNANSKCTPKPINNTYHFTIDNLRRCNSSCNSTRGKSFDRSSCYILLGVDEDRGGSLMEGYQWMTALEDCMKQVSRFCEVKNGIEQQWLT